MAYEGTNRILTRNKRDAHNENRGCRPFSCFVILWASERNQCLLGKKERKENRFCVIIKVVQSINKSLFIFIIF